MTRAQRSGSTALGRSCPGGASRVSAVALKTTAEPSGLLDHDGEVKALALDLWANRIETGDRNLSADRAQETGRPVPALDPRQVAFVARLRRLAEEERPSR